MKKPYIISFCGIDGSGKTTQLKRLSEYLKMQGLKVIESKVKINSLGVFFELSDRLFGNPNSHYPEIFPLAVRAGVAIDVARHFLKIEEEAKGYDFLLCDRHAICYRAFGMVYGEEDEWVKRIFSLASEPDLIFYFDTCINISNKRIHERMEKPPWPDENPNLLNEVKKCYEKLLKGKSNVVRINGNSGIENVFSQIHNYMIENSIL